MLPKNQKIDTKTLKDATLIINMSYIRYFKKISIIVFFKQLEVKKVEHITLKCISWGYIKVCTIVEQNIY